MFKNLSLFILSLFITVTASWAKPVNKTVAENLAKNFVYERIQEFQALKLSEIELKLVYTETEWIDNGVKNLYYVFNLENKSKGFIIISADDNAYPVLSYSFENRYSLEIIPDGFRDMMEFYEAQLVQIIKLDLTADANIEHEWDTYLAQKISRNHLRSVSPLTKTTWDQNKYFNASCPSDSKGPDGHVYAGCVAVSMAQVMAYHQYPAKGSGSHSYYHSTYGTLSSNFSLSTYDWSSMPNSLSTYNSDVADLLYDCGVSVEMNYSPSGSGAYTSDAAQALKDYFDYASTARLTYASSYTSSGWESVLTNELDSSRPMIYRGQGSSGGHAWVCDGYQGSGNDHFHMNWGWSGYKNGYYYVSNLNPGITLTSYQGAIIGIEPNGTTANYDLKLYASISVTPSPVVKNGSISVSCNVANYGSGDFSGNFLAALFDANGDYVTDIEELSNYQLGSMKYYTNGISFNKSTLAVSAGTYSVGIFYKESSGNWQLMDAGNYSNPVSITVTTSSTSTGLALYDSIQVSPNPIAVGKAISVYVDFANYDQTNDFYGDFACVLHKTTGEVLEVIDTFNNMKLTAYSHYTNGITFTNSGLTSGPGEYLISIQHKPTGGSWQITDEDVYVNPIKITIAPPPLQADKYEDNNTEAKAYSLTPSFNNDAARIQTSDANIHLDTDIDYFKIDLPKGYKYTISPRVHDSHNSGDGNTYDGDVTFSYKLDNWSSAFNDAEASDINLSDGRTIYFKVEPYYYDKGSYKLDIKITRTMQKADLFVSNENADPLEINAGDQTNLSCKIKNQGVSDAPSSTIKFYLSDDQNYNSWDVELGSSNVGALKVGEETTVSKNVLIPSNTAPGNWYIIFKADADNAVPESDEMNNRSYQLVKINKVNGINEEQAGFRIYPNPTTDFVLIENKTGQDMNVVQLCNIKGEIIQEFSNVSTSQPLNIDVRNLACGMYLIRINRANSIQQFTIEIQ